MGKRASQIKLAVEAAKREEREAVMSWLFALSKDSSKDGRVLFADTYMRIHDYISEGSHLGTGSSIAHIGAVDILMTVGAEARFLTKFLRRPS